MVGIKHCLMEALSTGAPNVNGSNTEVADPEKSAPCTEEGCQCQPDSSENGLTYMFHKNDHTSGK